MAQQECTSCEREVYSDEGQKMHDLQYPRYCEEHNICHGSWHGHVRQFEHSQCTIGDCKNNKPKFWSNAEYLRHFNKFHAGSEKVYATDGGNGAI